MHIFSYSSFTFSAFCFLLIHLDAAFGKSHEARGTLTITSGVTYNPNLQDKLSVDFKVLAFDIQQMVGDLLSSTSLKFHNIVSLTTCQKIHRSCSLWKKLVNKCNMLRILKCMRPIITEKEITPIQFYVEYKDYFV